MGRRGTELPAAVRRVQVRVERWRERRATRGRMPEELWTAAVSLARVHGLYPIARALRLDYGSLKKRVERSPDSGSEDTDNVVRFVEIDPRHLVPPLAPSGPVVELLDVEGTTLVIRLSGGESLDVPAVVEAFRRRR
ncbi:MAG: hypothetical protein ABIF77_14425 [bacterium]